MQCPMKFNQFAMEKGGDFKAARENAECIGSECGWYDQPHGQCAVTAMAYELMQSRCESKK